MYSTAENRRKLRRLRILDLPVQHKVTDIAERAHGARRRELGEVSQRALGGLLGFIPSQIGATSREYSRNMIRWLKAVEPATKANSLISVRADVSAGQSKRTRTPPKAANGRGSAL